MKKSQKGIVPVVIILVVAVAFIVVDYYIVKNKSVTPNVSEIPVQTQITTSISADIAILNKKIASSTSAVEKTNLIKERDRLLKLSKDQEASYQKMLVDKQKKADEIRASLSTSKKIGDTFTLWGIDYQVISATNFYPDYDFQKTTGKYIGIKIKATNNGKSELGVNKIYVQDSKGRQYQSVVLGYQQLNVEDYGANVKAGFTKTMGIIFEVAKDSTGLELEFPSAQGPIAQSVKLGL